MSDRLTRFASAIGAWCVATCHLYAQSPPPSFEVASIRPNQSQVNPLRGEGVPRLRPGGRFEAINVSLRALIAHAYGVRTLVEIEGDQPILERRFDVLAITDADVQTFQPSVIGPLNVSLQNLLAERFRLRVRWKDSDADAYELVRKEGALGPGIRAAQIECSPKDEHTRRACRSTIGGRLTAGGTTMTTFAVTLSVLLERQVVDRTALKGPFDLGVTFSSLGLAKTEQGSTFDGAPSFFTALEEQLNLRLQPVRIAVRMLVVQRVEPPTEN